MPRIGAIRLDFQNLAIRLLGLFPSTGAMVRHGLGKGFGDGSHGNSSAQSGEPALLSFPLFSPRCGVFRQREKTGRNSGGRSPARKAMFWTWPGRITRYASVREDNRECRMSKSRRRRPRRLIDAAVGCDIVSSRSCHFLKMFDRAKVIGPATPSGVRNLPPTSGTCGIGGEKAFGLLFIVIKKCCTSSTSSLRFGQLGPTAESTSTRRTEHQYLGEKV